MIEFEAAVSKPENWFRQSWEMFHASRALYQTFAKGGPIRHEEDNLRRVGSLKGALLLLGFSVENALKGAHVHQFPPDLTGGQLKSTSFHKKAHNLVEVANSLDLSLTVAQVDLLERLTNYIQWSSRYQAPLRKADHANPQAKIRLEPDYYNISQNLILELQNRSGYSKQSGWPRSIHGASF